MSRFTTMHIRVPNSVIRQMHILASKEGKTLNEMANTLLEDALALRLTIENAVSLDQPVLLREVSGHELSLVREDQAST